jgi:hypothetical protein
MSEGALVRYGFMYEYLYFEDECWRELCVMIKKHLAESAPKQTRMSINNCPMETALQIMSYMDAASLARWGQTCRLFVEPSLFDIYWDNLCRLDYCLSIVAFNSKSKFIMKGSRTAKQLYVKTHSKFRELLSAPMGSMAVPKVSINASLLQGIIAF